LNRATLVGFRRRLQVAVTALGSMDSVEAEAVLRDILVFPNDLPNLRRLRPPANSRADGVDQSYFAQRERGELPEFYIA
jgi:hypothetical protein